jgi:LmbE family N-acetylglucosaminyl deacetylase
VRGRPPRRRRITAAAVAAVALAGLLTAAASPPPAWWAPAAIGQTPTSPAPARTILAVGAHAGDAELTSGLLLARQRMRGDRVVILHLTLGEGGNPRLSPEAYGPQKRREALAVGAALGAEVLFAPYRDGELPLDEAARRYVADVIRRVKPTYVITHWRESLHKDHATTHAVVRDAVLLASLAGVASDHPPHRGVRAVWYAENWEDAEGFRPYVYADVTGALDRWREAVSLYEFVRGGISAFRYLDYYTALATVRGAEARKTHAVAFDVEAYAKRRVVDSLP